MKYARAADAANLPTPIAVVVTQYHTVAGVVHVEGDHYVIDDPIVLSTAVACGWVAPMPVQR